MDSYSPRQRLFVQDDLAENAVVTVEADQAHYLLHVLRLGAGAPLAVFNGRDGEWAAELEPQGKRHCVLNVRAHLRPQVGVPDIWLLFAPVKGQRTEFIAEKATELGVRALVPVITRRTIVTRVNQDRLAANAREAAEQCWRLDVPEVREAQPLDRVLGAWPAERKLMFCDETGTAPLASAVLAQHQPGPWAVLIGPEGGFAPEELDVIRRMKAAVPVGLGPRILRADTAAVAALTILQSALGDLRG